MPQVVNFQEDTSSCGALSRMGVYVASREIASRINFEVRSQKLEKELPRLGDGALRAF
jgi:hypothetical protein